jgi:hypothetical protein
MYVYIYKYIGTAVPVYGVEEFDKKEYNEVSGLFDK